MLATLSYIKAVYEHVSEEALLRADVSLPLPGGVHLIGASYKVPNRMVTAYKVEHGLQETLIAIVGVKSYLLVVQDELFAKRCKTFEDNVGDVEIVVAVYIGDVSIAQQAVIVPIYEI